MLIFAKPDYHSTGVSVYRPHEEHLDVSFGDIVLIDAYRVDPQAAVIVFVTEVSQRRL
jgi:hypothetical protein